MKNLIEKQVLEFCREQELFVPSDTVVVGVSGGADSVCLLCVLHALREVLGIRLVAAHLNHGVRKEAVEDAAYVKTLCETLAIPYYEKSVDVPALSKVRRLGEEQVGRMERYAFFEEVQKQTGAQRIAVAHNKNDRAETVLFHLFRGSAAAGLAGIRARRGDIVRPLLCLTREQIEEYLNAIEMSYCHDKTNDTDEYARNRIRHHILSYAKQEICDGAVENICSAAVHMERMQEYVLQQTIEAMALCEETAKRQPAGRTFSIDRLKEQDAFLQENIIFEALKQLSEDGRDIYRTHVEVVMGLVETEGNRYVNVSGGIVVSRSYDLLIMERYVGEGADKDEPAFAEIDTQALSGEPMQVCVAGKGFTLQVLDFTGRMEDVPQNTYTKWLDYDKINDKLFIRTRQIGDYFMVKHGDTICRKKLKSFFIDEKIPAGERDTQLFLAQGEHVLCLLPGRMSEYYKVTENTKKILQISIEGSCI